MATMTVLPSFQAFLQSATGSRSPPAASASTSSASPTFYYQQQQQQHFRSLSPTSWVDAADRLYAHVSLPSPCSSSSEEDDEMDGRFGGIRPRARSDGYKRRLAAIGSDACSSPTRVLPSLERSASAEAGPGATKRQKKKYLKERERCEIVRRVRAGEKQAHLAKEFGVSRAAVCYLLKHQMEILRRSSERL